MRMIALWIGRLPSLAYLLLILILNPIKGQSIQDVAKSQAQNNWLELIITSSARPDGHSAEVQLSSIGLLGAEIVQLRAEDDPAVVGKAVLGHPDSNGASRLAQMRLVLEKAAETNRIVLVIYPVATPGKSIRLVVPAEPTPMTGSVTVGIVNHPIMDDGGGASGGGCYPISWTSLRCGKITACCPTTAVDIDGVSCTITCR